MTDSNTENFRVTREKRLEETTAEAFESVFKIEWMSYAIDDAEDREFIAGEAKRLIALGKKMLKILAEPEETVSETLETMNADSV